MQFVKRNWGFYIVLLDRKHFKIKLLRFKPHGKLSYQYHNHRSELWLFLKGVGKFNHFPIGAGDFMLTMPKDKHIYYSSGITWAIEVQFGEKCVEEDIVRI